MSGIRRTRTTKSKMAGLTFPVSRIRAMLKAQDVAPKITNKAAVYMTSVLEYFTAEIIEKSMQAAHAESKSRIQPRHLNEALKKDADLKFRFTTCTVPKSQLIPVSEIFPVGEIVAGPSTSGESPDTNRPYLGKKHILKKSGSKKSGK